MHIDDIQPSDGQNGLDVQSAFNLAHDAVLQAFIAGLRIGVGNGQLHIRDGNEYRTMTARELVDALDGKGENDEDTYQGHAG